MKETIENKIIKLIVIYELELKNGFTAVGTESVIQDLRELLDNQE